MKRNTKKRNTKQNTTPPSNRIDRSLCFSVNRGQILSNYQQYLGRYTFLQKKIKIGKEKKKGH